MNRFAATRSSGLGRKAFWIAVAAIVAMMLTWASAVLSYPLIGDGPYEYNVDGMPRPDGFLRQQNPGHPPINYHAQARSDGSIVITRNGVKWVTLSNKNHEFQLSDPNGTGRTVVRMYGVSGHGAAPIKVRAPGH